MISEYFSDEELGCHCGCGGTPKLWFVTLLEEIQKRLDFKMVLSSVYRCAKHNVEVSTTGSNGPHVQGLGADVVCNNTQALELMVAGIKAGITGIGVSQKGDMNKRFIHVDSAHETLTLWSY